MRWGEVRWGEVRRGEARRGEARWGEVRWGGSVRCEKKKLKCPAFSVEGRKGSLFGRIIWFSALLGRDKMYLVSVELLVHRLPRFPASRGHHFSGHITKQKSSEALSIQPVPGIKIVGNSKKAPRNWKIAREQTKAGRDRLPFASRVSLTLMKVVM